MGGLDFSRRSTEREIIDDLALDRDQMDEVLSNLGVVNRYLGGYSTTLGALDRLVPRGDEPVRLLDVGAGGGDMARRLVEWGRERGQRVTVTSVDLSHAAAAYAREALGDTDEATVVEADVFALPFPPESFDVALCALFLHHFPQEEAARLLEVLYGVSRYGVVVNDLHRHPLAYAGIWSLTRLLGASPIVAHDGPLSVLRAFARDDFADLSARTGLPMDVTWHWAFRYRVVIPKDPNGPARTNARVAHG